MASKEGFFINNFLINEFFFKNHKYPSKILNELENFHSQKELHQISHIQPKTIENWLPEHYHKANIQGDIELKYSTKAT